MLIYSIPLVLVIDLELEILMPTQNIIMVMMKALLLETIEIGKGKVIIYFPIQV